MLVNSKTTVTELLANGAFIEGSNGESLSDLISIGGNKACLYDLTVSKLIDKNAVIGLPNGMNISKIDSQVVLSSPNQEATIDEFGYFQKLSDDLNVDIVPFELLSCREAQVSQIA